LIAAGVFIQRNYTNTAVAYFRINQLFFTCGAFLIWLDPKETKTKDKGSYQIAPLSCNFAYTRSIKEDFGFQDPFGASSVFKKVTGNRLFEAWE